MASATRHNRCPRAGAHRAVRHLHDTAFESDAEVAVQLFARAPGARDRASDRFFVSKWLVGHSRRYVDGFDCDGGHQTRYDGTRCGQLDPILRSDRYSSRISNVFERIVIHEERSDERKTNYRFATGNCRYKKVAEGASRDDFS